MTQFFLTQERIDKLVAVANSWIGTPFVPNAAIKGRGVSCQKLAGAIYNECGFETGEIPEGSMAWGKAHKESESLIVKWIDEHPQFVSIDNTLALLPGDLVGFKIGGCVQHLGIMIDKENFIHARQREGVNIHNIMDATYLTIINNVWRPSE